MKKLVFGFWHLLFDVEKGACFLILEAPFSMPKTSFGFRHHLEGVRWIQNPLDTPGSACLHPTRRIFFSWGVFAGGKKNSGSACMDASRLIFSRLYLFKSAWSQKNKRVRPACFLHPSGKTQRIHRTHPHFTDWYENAMSHSKNAFWLLSFITVFYPKTE